MSSATAPSSTRCQPSVTTSSPTFEAAGGTGTLAIGVARECSWDAASRSSWITITSAATGQGDGTVSYKIAENVDPVARQGTLAVADVQVSLSQKAAPCRYEVAPGAEAVGSAGGSAPIEVHAHSACSWTATPEVPYADVNPRAGSGSATVNLIVMPNAGGERMVTATVAGQRVTLPQRGAAATPAPQPTPAPAPAPAPAPSPAPGPAPAPTPEPAPTPGPTPVSAINLEGKVESVSGTCPALTFVLKSETVFTTEATVFNKLPCKDVKKGTQVKVSGWRLSDGSIRADQVEKN